MSDTRVKDLPVPPNVPDWLESELQTVGPLFNEAVSAPRRQYIRAAVYAQLWRDDEKRIGENLPELIKERRYVYAKSFTKIRFECLENADICAAAMKG